MSICRSLKGNFAHEFTHPSPKRHCMSSSSYFDCLCDGGQVAQHSCVVSIKLFHDVFCEAPSGASICYIIAE